MSKKLKEKSKNTQKDSTFNVDNEIIIGIKKSTYNLPHYTCLFYHIYI